MLGAVLLNRMVWESITEKVLSEQRRRRGASQEGVAGGERVFQAQGPVSAKVLSPERSVRSSEEAGGE